MAERLINLHGKEFYDVELFLRETLPPGLPMAVTNIHPPDWHVIWDEQTTLSDPILAAIARWEAHNASE
jgi:hypothetical protein